MALSVQGSVTVERGTDKARQLLPMDLLRTDDRLSAAADAEAMLVFLKDGTLEKLKPRVRATIGASRCTPAEAVERQQNRKLSSAQLTSLHQLARSSRAGVAVFRGEEPAPAQVPSPMDGATALSNRPRLSWSAVARAESYLVELRGEKERLLWKATTKEPRCDYPADQEALAWNGEYSWRVAARFGDGKQKWIVEAAFLVAAREEAQELAALKPLRESKAPHDWLVAASTYDAHKVYDEALPLYERLAEQYPREAGFQVILADFHERTGRLDRAKAASERARALGATVRAK
jgi:hypothetical protein